MPYEISWYTRDRIIYEQLYGDFSLDDIYNIGREFDNYVSQSVAPVHLVVNMGNIKTYPTDLNAMRRRLGEFNKSGIGWIIVLIAPENPPLVYMCLGMIQFLIPRVHLRFMKRLDEAITFLQSGDPTLPDELTPEYVKLS